MADSRIARVENEECQRLWNAFQLRKVTEHELAKIGRENREEKTHKLKQSSKGIAQSSRKPVIKTIATTPGSESRTSSGAMEKTKTSDGKVIRKKTAVAEKAGGTKITKKKATVKRADIGVNTDEVIPARKVDVGVMVKPEKTPFGMSGEETKYLKELAILKVEMDQIKTELNTEKSNRMVAEQLYSIVQQDVGALQVRMASESNAKAKLENALADCKVELAHTERMLKDKEQRIEELEESLRQSNRFAKKLEDQSLLNRIGRNDVDHMLDMQLNKTKTAESQRKLEICQNELLQSREETRKLLDKVEEMMQERSEMVTHRVHTQLLKISDSRADDAEKRVQEMEQEMEMLRAEMGRMKTMLRQQNEEKVTTASEMTFGLSSSLIASKSMFSSPFSSVAMANTDPYSSIYKMPMLASPFAPGQSESISFDSKFSLELDPGPITLGSSKVENKPLQHVEKLSKGIPDLVSKDQEIISLGGQEEATAEETIVSGDHQDTKEEQKVERDKPSEEEDKEEKEEKDDEGEEEKEEKEKEDDDEEEEEEEEEVASTEGLSELPDLDDIVTGKMEETPNHSEDIKVVEVGEDSSDWGSSSEDEGEPLSKPPPLQTQIPPEASSSPTSPSKTTALSSPSPKQKPPLKPKPVLNVRAKFFKDAVFKETPSSFDDPLVSPSLKSLYSDFHKPSGPEGRRLPSRYLFLPENNDNYNFPLVF